MAEEQKEWRALDHCYSNRLDNSAIFQDGDQSIFTKQKSKELIVVKDSEDITVHTTDTQAAVNLQVGLQAAIVAVLSITIGDTDRANFVAQDIFQLIGTKQTNNQKTIIVNSKHVNVTTTDTDLSVNIQALLQILIVIIARLDIL
ncbi:spore coat protein [Metabacillus bambusae]|uniref:Spore coat protein n=1 Tax=Metabacillus bambusae TaxID=2795218 RepID=A0ABS3NA80_9BACI|nr:spore coat protein [Metabacillus bambusae]MBO1515192.1 spore coat protein [Metabacillus bambusae]